MRYHCVIALALWAIALFACSRPIISVSSHNHQGCGHSFVADEAKQWAQQHTKQQQQLQQRRDIIISSSRPAVRRLEAAPKVPIRIWVEYQGTDGLTAAGRQRLREVVGKAVAVLQKFYKVRWPTAGHLLVPPQCGVTDRAGNCYAHRPDFLSDAGSSSSRSARNSCGSAAINSSHIAAYTQCSVRGGGCTDFPGGQGEATDYYLYVSARNDDACRSGAAAWALPCLFDPATNRPLLGTANLCPSSLAQDDAHAAAAVLVHELHHALGFTDQLLDKFIDAQGQPIPEDKVVQLYATPYGERTPMIITPTVAKEVQAQFGCSEVPGAALENEGGRGSALAHWEYKWFQGEIMVATNLFGAHGGAGTLSRVTLALMQDSGWYDVNWGEAGFLDWGWQAGCDFVGKTCTAYAAAHPGQQYFCTKEQYSSDNVNTVCTFDGLARAACAEAPFAEGCAMKVALGTAPNCLSQRFSSRAGDIFGWQNGPNSRCLPVTWPFETARYRFPGSVAADDATMLDSRCYETSCTPTGQLQLSIWGNKVDCPSGQTVDLAKALPGVFEQGLIGPCPDNAAACGSLACGEGCSGDGVCVAGKCYCGLMYTGPGCRTRVTAGGVLPAGNISSNGSSSSSNSSAYVPPPDSSIRVLGGGMAGDTGDTGDTDVTASNRNVTRSVSDRSVTAEDGPIVSEAAPGSAADYDDIGDGNTIKVSLLLDSSPQALRVLSRRFITAVAQLAGVDESQVTLLPLTAAPGVAAASLTLSTVSNMTSDNVTDSEGNGNSTIEGSRLASSNASQTDIDALEVTCRIETSSAAEASRVVSNVSNAARQEWFARQLSDTGLQLVPGSVGWLALNQGWQGGVNPGGSGSSSSGRQIHGSAAAVVAAVLLLAAVALVA